MIIFLFSNCLRSYNIIHSINVEDSGANVSDHLLISARCAPRKRICFDSAKMYRAGSGANVCRARVRGVGTMLTQVIIVNQQGSRLLLSHHHFLCHLYLAGCQLLVYCSIINDYTTYHRRAASNKTVHREFSRTVSNRRIIYSKSRLHFLEFFTIERRSVSIHLVPSTNSKYLQI